MSMLASGSPESRVPRIGGQENTSDVNKRGSSFETQINSNYPIKYHDKIHLHSQAKISTTHSPNSNSQDDRLLWTKVMSFSAEPRLEVTRDRKLGQTKRNTVGCTNEHLPSRLPRMELPPELGSRNSASKRLTTSQGLG